MIDPTIPDDALLKQWLLPLVGHAVEFERTGRHVVAAAALVTVRGRYAALNSTDLAADEQSWSAFAGKHIPLSPERIDELIGGMVHRGGLLRCTKCGTPALCPCGCGVPYAVEHRAWAEPIAKVATALERAAAAVTANPARSNRAIAKEIGVSDQTVRRARRQFEDYGSDVALDHAPPK